MDNSKQQIKVRHFFYISNLLSLFRVLLMFPLIYFFEKRIFEIVIPLSVFIILTDFLDGLLARKLKQVTDLGKFLDPLADKIAMAIIIIYLAYIGKVPVWFVLVLLVRDIIVFLGGIYLKAKTGVLVQSNIWGKLTTTVISVYFLFCIIDFLVSLEIFIQILLILSNVFLFISTTSYVINFINKMNKGLHENEE